MTLGGVSQNEISVNELSGSPWVSLVAPGASPSAPYGTPLDGKYGVVLQDDGTQQAAGISQTGTIPAGSKSLQFLAVQELPSSGSLQLFVGSQPVPFTQIGQFQYAANISAWAGQTESIAFSAGRNSFFDNAWELDDISFSPNAVPEPSTLVLMGIGTITAFMRLKPKYS